MHTPAHWPTHVSLSRLLLLRAGTAALPPPLDVLRRLRQLVQSLTHLVHDD